MSRDLTAKNEDIMVVKDYVLCDMILDVLELDLKKIISANPKMLKVYNKIFDKANEHFVKISYDIKKEMMRSGIKVFENTRNKDSIQVKFLVRGYQHEFSMLGSYVKSEIQVRLSNYFELGLNDIL